MRNNAPTILIVEDDERIRNLMRTVLTGAGYATLETGNAATAVSMLSAWVWTLCTAVSIFDMSEL